MNDHVEEDIIKPKMADRVVEILGGNIWEYGRIGELEGNVGLFCLLNPHHHYQTNKPLICGSPISLTQVNHSLSLYLCNHNIYIYISRVLIM